MMTGTKEIYECKVPKVEGMEGSLRYFATESEITTEDYSCKVYGIRVEKWVDRVLDEYEEYSDVTVEYDDIIKLVNLMSKNMVTPVTAGDIIEDYINK